MKNVHDFINGSNNIVLFTAYNTTNMVLIITNSRVVHLEVFVEKNQEYQFTRLARTVVMDDNNDN